MAGKIDEEIKPTVDKLKEATDELISVARQAYVPSKVADTVIGENLPVEQQLQLYVASAHLALTSMYCQKKLANEPVPEKIVSQIARVQGYLKKLKEHGIDISTSSTSSNNNNNNVSSSPTSSAAAKATSTSKDQKLKNASGTRRQRVEENQNQNQNEQHQEEEEEEKEGEDISVEMVNSATGFGGSRKTKLNAKAVENVKEMAQSKFQRDV